MLLSFPIRWRLVGVDEVFLSCFGVWFDGLGARGPVGWADLAVLVRELECLDEAESFLDRSETNKYRMSLNVCII